MFQQNSTCGPIQLLDLCFVSVNEELVQVVLSRGLVVVPPAQENICCQPDLYICVLESLRERGRIEMKRGYSG